MSILPGVTIGENAIVGTGSIVTKDIPDNAVAVGLSSKAIRLWKNAYSTRQIYLLIISDFDRLCAETIKFLNGVEQELLIGYLRDYHGHELAHA